MSSSGFVRLPNWIVDDYFAGKLRQRRYDVLVVLHRKANGLRLRDGKPTPKLRLETLAEGCRYDGDVDSLRRTLDRMRADGQLTYVAEGNAHHGWVYEFTLKSERPGLSGHCPPKNRPPEAAAEPEQQSDLPPLDRSKLSALETAPQEVGCPPKYVNCPPNEHRANADAETVSASAARDVCPPYQDVQEKTTNRSEEWLHGEGSTSHAGAPAHDAHAGASARDAHAYAHEGGDSLTDRLLAAVEAMPEQTAETPWQALAGRQAAEAAELRGDARIVEFEVPGIPGSYICLPGHEHDDNGQAA